jgi:hypothetical protein
LFWQVVCFSNFVFLQICEILGALRDGGFLNEDLKQHALKENSTIVKKIKYVDTFRAVSRELELLVSVVVLVGNVYRCWRRRQSVASVGGVSRSFQSIVSVDAVSRCCESVVLFSF